MRDRILSVFSMLVLIGFLGILIWKVPRLDLGAVILLTLALAAYDFFLYERNGRGS